MPLFLPLKLLPMTGKPAFSRIKDMFTGNGSSDLIQLILVSFMFPR